ncbi:MAG: holo-ACP synthase [Phycisphaeraceae bacterium]|nr:holo-ACP synthase [Phycisphaeraceae bacterium]
MDVIAHGVDVVAIERIALLLEAHGPRFIQRVYTTEEQRYAEISPVRRAERYAVRFAAKEAALKALGTGLRGGIQWTDIEVVGTLLGAPQLILHGEALVVAERLGIERWLISMSHSGGMALASVLGGRPSLAEGG